MPNNVNAFILRYGTPLFIGLWAALGGIYYALAYEPAHLEWQPEEVVCQYEDQDCGVKPEGLYEVGGSRRTIVDGAILGLVGAAIIGAATVHYTSPRCPFCRDRYDPRYSDGMCDHCRKFPHLRPAPKG